MIRWRDLPNERIRLLKIVVSRMYHNETVGATAVCTNPILRESDNYPIVCMPYSAFIGLVLRSEALRGAIFRLWL